MVPKRWFYTADFFIFFFWGADLWIIDLQQFDPEDVMWNLRLSQIKNELRLKKIN